MDMTPKVVAQLLYLLRQVPKAFLAAVFLASPVLSSNTLKADAQKHLSMGWKLKDAKIYDRAITEATLAIEGDPTLAKAYLLRAKCLEYSPKKEGDALRDLKKSMDLDPSDGETYETIALYYIELKQNDEALKALNAGIKRCPKKHSLYHYRSQVYEELNERDKAVKDMDTYLALMPSAIAYAWRGQAYERAGKPDQALKDYDTAIKQKGVRRDIYRLRAHLLSKMGRYREAITDYTFLLNFDPEEDDSLQFRAEAFAQLKEFPKAISDYTAAIAVSPDSAGKLHMARAELYEKIGKHELAEKDRLKAKDLRRSPAERPIY